MAVSDDELYGQYLAGDDTAIDILIRKYTGRLILYLNGLTHQTQDSEDLVIETFAALVAKKPTIRPGNFQAYLYRAVRNRAVTLHIFRRKREVFALDEAQVEATQAVRPEDEYLRDEHRQTVHRCLNRIDPELREALWLVYCEDMTYAQAAAILGVNAKKVNHWLTKGKQQMKEELAKEGITHADE